MNSDEQNIISPTIGPESEKVPEIFQRHIGKWKGEYIKVNAQGQFLRSFSGTFTIWIEGTTYHQVNHYVYPDGRQLQLNFQGEFVDRILKFNSTDFSTSAMAWEIDSETIFHRARKVTDGGVIVFVETITLLDREHRVRSTHEFKDGVFVGVNFIEEIRLLA